MRDTTTYYDVQDEKRAEAGAENMQARVQAPSPGTVHTPHSNTGCTFHNPPELLPTQETNSSFSFDWYQATLSTSVDPQTALRWGQFIGESMLGRPKNGYEYSWDYGQANISYGGQTGKYGVHVKIQGGDACPDLVAYVRESFPEHKVSRVDVCMDFRGPTAWEDLKKILLKVARKFGVETRVGGDWLSGKKGRTLYLNPREKGKEAKTYMCRLYEKGHQMRAVKHIPDAPLDWVRLEFEVHPPKHTRHLVASMTPDQVARSSRWMRAICDALGAVPADRVRLSTRRIKPPVIDSLENMFRQYCGPIKEVKRDAWMEKEEWMQACSDVWDREAFGGLPADIRRNWYF